MANTELFSMICRKVSEERRNIYHGKGDGKMSNQMMDIQSVTAKMKADSSKMAALSLETRNSILKNVKEALLNNKEAIFEANKMDMDAADENGVTEAVKKRLKFDEHKLMDVTQGMEELIKLADPHKQNIIICFLTSFMIISFDVFHCF